jgi:hypothetical protein
MTITLATPWALLAALVGLVPMTVAAVRVRAARRVRGELGLDEPPARAHLMRPLALACLFALLGLAAARPALRTQHERLARTDAEALVVLDSSRSMLASSAPDAPPRYQRAVAFAHRLHDALPDVAIGVGSLTNRVLPYLFPTADASAYDLVLDKAFGIERPPPSLTPDRWVTTFDPLNEVAVRHFFSPTAHRRVLVMLSDAETHQFDSASVLRHLQQTGTTPVVVRFWQPNERIFRGGRPLGNYRSVQPGAVTELRDAGWAAYGENDLGRALALVQQTIGTGPVARVGFRRHETSIAPILALAALAPLLLLIAPGGRLPALRLRSRPRRPEAPALAPR